MKVHKTIPIGSQEVRAFVDRRKPDGSVEGDIEVLTISEYANDPRRDQLRNLRLKSNMTIGQAARLAGISPATWSSLERGGYEPDSWEEAFEMFKHEATNED